MNLNAIKFFAGACFLAIMFTPIGTKLWVPFFLVGALLGIIWIVKS